MAQQQPLLGPPPPPWVPGFGQRIGDGIPMPPPPSPGNRVQHNNLVFGNLYRIKCTNNPPSTYHDVVGEYYAEAGDAFRFCFKGVLNRAGVLVVPNRWHQMLHRAHAVGHPCAVYGSFDIMGQPGPLPGNPGPPAHYEFYNWDPANPLAGGGKKRTRRNRKSSRKNGKRRK